MRNYIYQLMLAYGMQHERLFISFNDMQFVIDKINMNFVGKSNSR